MMGCTHHLMSYLMMKENQQIGGRQERNWVLLDRNWEKEKKRGRRENALQWKLSTDDGGKAPISKSGENTSQ